MGHASRVVNQYLEAFWSGDFDTARTLVADAFSFQGPFLQTDDKRAFFAGSSGLLPIMRGYRLLRQWEDGDEVCSVYEFNVGTPAGAGSVFTSEWDTVRDGRLSAVRLVFDTAVFRRFVPAPSSP
jgi:hypothetical protein